MSSTIEKKVISDFGNEWEKFNQLDINLKENKKIFNLYFKSFPFDKIKKNSIGADIGCGSGRWAYFISKKNLKLYCIDASIKSINSAKKLLKNNKKINFIKTKILNFRPEKKLDFAYSLGVLHHVIDTRKHLIHINSILKKNSPFLIYLYYKLENRPLYYRVIWKLTDLMRFLISSMPKKIKFLLCDAICFLVYVPLSKLYSFLEKLGLATDKLPLSFYKNRPISVLRNDSLDRFGTKLEKRYTKNEIFKLLKSTGFKNIKFNNFEPYWCAICYKK